MDQLPGICWDVTTRVFRCARVHVGYAFKVNNNLSSLQTKWRGLQDIRHDVETRIMVESTAEMQITRDVNNWLQQLQNLQQIIEDIEANGSKEIHNTCLSGRCPKNIVSSYKIGRKVADKIVEVNELVIRGNHYLESNVVIVQRIPPNLVDDMPTGETVGLDLMLDKVWKSLNDDNVGIIGLYGMGGAGKTTLLKRVHNELGNKEHKFELVLWVVVSKDWNINKIMNDIRNRIGIQDGFWERSSNDERAARIYQVLKQKRYVLMLDDLWDKLELESIGVPHPKENGCQSKVVLTTRSEDVCSKMEGDVKLKVECLSSKEAFDLFCKKVGRETLKWHREIPEIAREMSEECGGLPLALITVGSALAGVKSVEAWRQARNDLSKFCLTGPSLEEKVFSILKFSYDRLPDEAHRNCFLYCALYPEDYAIHVEELIDRWIGEGFLGKGKKYVSKRSIYDMREEGRSIIEKLKFSSLLEDGTNFDSIYWRMPEVKMHDMIRDMALWLARDRNENKYKVIVEREAFTMDSEGFNVVERISITDVGETWQQIPVCPNLITLCAQYNLDIRDFSNLQFMTRLKVLDLSRNRHIKYLPIAIGMLINLEFLNLSSLRMSRTLPIELKNLQQLRVFIMEYTEAKIPLEVFDGLKLLQVLSYYCSFGITKEKEEILLEKLESLPKLEELGANLETITGMHRLFNSKKLEGCLRKFYLYRVENVQLEMASLLGGWSTMKHLEIMILDNLNDIREVLCITPQIHTWHLDKLRELHIHNCNSITHLTWLRYAPLLESLNVYDCDSMEEVVKGDQDEDDYYLFSNLRSLVLDSVPKLKSIHKRSLPFPSLQSIHIIRCHELRKLPLNSNSAKDTLLVIRGYNKKWWNNLEWEDPAAKDLFHSKFVEDTMW